MLARCLAALVAVLTSCVLSTAAPPADPVTRQLTAQTALAQAKAALGKGQPAAAVSALEAALPCADGDPAFLALLKSAYTAELQAQPAADRATTLQHRLQLLGVEAATPVAAPETGAQSLAQATQLFRQSGIDPVKLATAAQFFAAAFRKVEMSPEQLAAWAFCRVRVAHDQLEQGANPAEIIAEVTEAQTLAPDHAGVQERAAAVLKLARTRSTTSGASLTTANFRVQGGTPELARRVADAAEAHRTAALARWSATPAPTWAVKCEVTLHADAGAFSAATAGSGAAAVTLENGQVATRRLHLNAADDGLLTNTLPRELTHILLADLFPDHAPPLWVAVGMAALATSTDEQGRYLRTLDRCAAANQLLPAVDLFATATPSAEQVTAFHVQSLAVVRYLVEQHGGPAVVECAMMCGRYGAAGAIQKVFRVPPATLARAWGG